MDVKPSVAPGSEPVVEDRLTSEQFVLEQRIIRERAERVRRELSMNHAYLPPQAPPESEGR